MVKRAVYAGTFDPPTLGHLWVISEAAQLFDEIIVAIGVNLDKRTMFSLEERKTMLKEIVLEYPNVQVSSFANQYLVAYAESVDSRFIIRGIRNSADYEYEKTMRHINGELRPDVTTVFLIPPPEVVEISSSAVKGLIGPDGWERIVSAYVPEAVLKKLLGHCHSLWTNLKAIGAQGEPDAFWKETLSPYFETSRHYHNWQHICSALADFYQAKDFAEDPLAVEVALWYHDAVYDTNTGDNEERSAELARSMIQRIGLSETFGDKVVNLVLATKHTVPPIDSDAQILVDIDLGILGKSEKEFDEYEQGIRKEYSWVTYEQFAAKRAQILQAFLDRPYIYSCKFFRDKYESKARDNLKRSIAKLRLV